VVLSPNVAPIPDEALLMEEALAAIRRAITDEEAGEMTLAPTAEPRSSPDKTDAGLAGMFANKQTKPFTQLARLRRCCI
jgi:hypothetical protein